jgi:hypothetical protein
VLERRLRPVRGSRLTAGGKRRTNGRTFRHSSFSAISNIEIDMKVLCNMQMLDSIYLRCDPT